MNSCENGRFTTVRYRSSCSSSCSSHYYYYYCCCYNINIHSTCFALARVFIITHHHSTNSKLVTFQTNTQTAFSRNPPPSLHPDSPPPVPFPFSNQCCVCPPPPLPSPPPPPPPLTHTQTHTSPVHHHSQSLIPSLISKLFSAPLSL